MMSGSKAEVSEAVAVPVVVATKRVDMPTCCWSLEYAWPVNSGAGDVNAVSEK